MSIEPENKLDPPPQLQVFTLDCWQYAALANWVKGVKFDIAAADNDVTALVSRSLSASGMAPTEVRSNAIARKVVEKEGRNILGGCQKRWKGRG